MRSTEKDFEAFINTIPQLAWKAKPNGEVYWCNERFYQYTGMTPDQIVKNSWESVHKPHLYNEIMSSWMSAVEAGSAWERLMPLKGRDGKFKWFMVRCIPIRNEFDEIVRWVGTGTDVNEQTKFQRQLTETLDAMTDTFLAIDNEWRIIQVNAVLLEETGMDKKDLIGKDFRDVFLAGPDQQKSKYWTEYHRLMKDRVPVTFEEYYEPMGLWTRVRAFPTSEGGFTIFSENFTKKKIIEIEMLKAKEEAERANMVKSDFLYKMSNEIRGPLGEILGYADNLRDPNLTKKERAAILDSLVQCGEQLSFIINDLIGLSKADIAS